jgi:hypothetical protein
LRATAPDGALAVGPAVSSWLERRGYGAKDFPLTALLTKAPGN